MGLFLEISSDAILFLSAMKHFVKFSWWLLDNKKNEKSNDDHHVVSTNDAKHSYLTDVAINFAFILLL